MRRGSWAIACLVGALAIAGCGKETHPNEPRPAIATEVTVAISDSDVSVQPSAIGKADSNQSLSQNEGQKEPRIKGDVPVIVTFIVVNNTSKDTRLRIEGPKNYTSNPILGNAPGTFKASLPTGDYSVSSTNTGGQASSFTVGPDRSSSSNDLLLP